MKKPEKFPNEIFVTMERDNDGALLLNAEKTERAAADKDEPTMVAEYRLVAIREVRMEPAPREVWRAAAAGH